MKKSVNTKSFFRRFGWVAGLKVLFWWGEEVMKRMIRFRKVHLPMHMVRYSQDRFSLVFWCGLSDRLCCIVEEKESLKIHAFYPWSFN